MKGQPNPLANLLARNTAVSNKLSAAGEESRLYSIRRDTWGTRPRGASALSRASSSRS